MKRMTRQKEFTFKLRGPTRLDKFEIERLVRPVNFIADNRMTKRGEMDADLVGASRFRNRAN